MLNYNEQKLKEGQAILIHAKNFAKDTHLLGFTDKIKTLQKLISLNQRTQRSTTHISLNFDSSEKLSAQQLQSIADVYMQKIGFGEQPYLVYQHIDAGHPHVHIVSTNIQRDGKAIRMFNIGRNQSENARKEIEQDFKLVTAEKQQKPKQQIKPVNVSKVIYGKTETRRAIANVLAAVLTTYKYASLPELNAILGQYNVMADRGSEQSRTFKNNGLVYRVLDERGGKAGVPIKASDIPTKPGLEYLKGRFLKNEPLKQPYKTRVKNAIDLYFLQHQSKSLDGLIKRLQQENINVVLRQNENGIIYGITYVDHQQKVVFNGSDLGKEYSANRMQQRFVQPITIKHNHDLPFTAQPSDTSGSGKVNEIWQVLTNDEQQSAFNSELKNEDLRKKRKRKLRH